MNMALDPIELKTLAIQMAAAMPPLPDSHLADVVNLAALQIDAALPTIRAGAEALGNTDEGRSMWMVAYLLESLHAKLESADDDVRGM